MTARCEKLRASVIIPTFNGAGKIAGCLRALRRQEFSGTFETIVVNDGSTDRTLEVLREFPEARVLTQSNAGPAAARNRGARAASGDILVFTDDDCEPFPDWLALMLKPFDDPETTATKGAYRTRQRELTARFVQAEYQDRYRLMSRVPAIDFVDTYSAAFRRDRFLEIGGYDERFPIACAEDVDLSFRMSGRGWKLRFVAGAIVNHRHPATLSAYLRKKFKFAFWRVFAVRKSPGKAIRDSHTPQLMKLQLLFAPCLIASLVADALGQRSLPLIPIVLSAFGLSTIPFSIRAFASDPAVGLVSPFMLAARSCSQFLGLLGGLGYCMAASLGTGSRPARTKNPRKEVFDE